jgi:hypothetical protein
MAGNASEAATKPATTGIRQMLADWCMSAALTVSGDRMVHATFDERTNDLPATEPASVVKRVLRQSGEGQAGEPKWRKVR